MVDRWLIIPSARVEQGGAVKDGPRPATVKAAISTLYCVAGLRSLSTALPGSAIEGTFWWRHLPYRVADWYSR